jgi:hypothetical protein
VPISTGTPAARRDADSLLWGLGFAALVFVGLLATDFSKVVAIVGALLAGVVAFLFVRLRGDDHLDRQESDPS